MKTITKVKKAAKIYQYIAKTNLPFGIKAGDIFTKTSNGFVNSKGSPIIYDCDGDTTFFKKEELVQPIHPVGTMLLLIKNLGKRVNSKNKYYNLTANTVFTFIKQDKSGVYMVNANGYEYRFSLTELEKSFANTTKYYYVSDAGNVRATYVNINATADVYRSKIGNMFEDEKSANDKLKKDVI